MNHADDHGSWHAFLAGFSERVNGAVDTHDASILGAWRQQMIETPMAAG